MKKIEILAPCGSSQSVIAAVRSGADAVYLGATEFSARAGAKNFSIDELAQTIEYCHTNNVLVYLTVNTIIFDNELNRALSLVKKAASLGIDALIVQDIGFASLVHKAIPELPLHGSTQMSIHTMCGAKALYQMGFKRVVLAREMTFDEIKEITQNCGIETEVFVHGALCMCVSGQCYFSAMLGSRSGNRGSCAQPCRLPFKVKGSNGYALSLKDNSIIEYITQLEQIGVTSAKIEGRMKRPEYTAAATSACVQSRDMGYVNEQTQTFLNSVFSRTGFTDGYITGNRGKQMFGYRQKDDVVLATSTLLSEIKDTYKHELKRIDIWIDFYASIGEKPVLNVTDGKISAQITGDTICEKAINKPLSVQKCEQQLSKTGATPYNAVSVVCHLEDGVTLPLSALNSIRRNALQQLTALRCKNHNYTIYDIKIPYDGQNKYKSAHPKPLKRARFINNNIPKTCKNFDIIYVPLTLKIEDIISLKQQGFNIAVEIPRLMFGSESKIKEKLTVLKQNGIKDVLAHNIGAVFLAKELGFIIHGGFGLNIVNTASLEWAKSYGLEDVELSFEMTIDQISSLGSDIKRGAICYGHLPLMATRNCPNKSGTADCKTCKNNIKLQDRLNVKFPIVCRGDYVEIVNSLPLLMPKTIYDKLAIDFEVFHFCVENYVENMENILVFNSKTLEKTKFTNGLYYRGVN